MLMHDFWPGIVATRSGCGTCRSLFSFSRSSQYVVCQEGVVSLFLKLSLAGVVCDMIVRMATARGDQQESCTRRRGLRGVAEAVRERVGRKVDQTVFDQAVIESHSPRPYGTDLPFAQVCLRLAQVCLWGEMTWLALLVNWGESPSSVASLAVVLGVCLIVVAKVLPGVVLSYLLGELLRGCVSAVVQVGSCTAQLVFGSCPPLTACPCLEA